MSSKAGGPPPIVYILLVLLLGGAAYWWFGKRHTPTAVIDNAQVTNPQNPNVQTATPPPPPPATAPNFALPETVPPGTTVTVRGSTSMVAVNESLKQDFQGLFPGTTVITSATGSTNGIEAVLSGNADLAAVSRPLTPEEANQGLVAVPVAGDAIALVVGVGNPFGQGLTQQQVVGIFTGQITNWSQIGGPDKPIRVLNRPPESGTRQAFAEIVLNGASFGNTPNITTLERDATTPMLRMLEDDGIGYATAAQIFNQSTVRPVAINGLTPAAPQYPYTRTLSYVYQAPPNPAVQAFLGYALSPAGKQAILTAGRE